MKFIHREGPQIAVYIQIKDLYHELSNRYEGEMPEIVPLSFKFKEEFALTENLYIRYTNTKIVEFFIKATYIPDYDKIKSMTEGSYLSWKAHFTQKILELKEKDEAKASTEISDIKYLLFEADIIRNHPDRLRFPNREYYPLFVMS